MADIKEVIAAVIPDRYAAGSSKEIKCFKELVKSEGVNKALSSYKKNENTQKKNNSGTKKTGQGLPMSKIENSSEENNAAQSSDGFESGRNKSKGHEIDYATTIEEAYDNLNSVLGGEGIQRLTADSKKLMEQQTQLAEAMKGMGPLLENIQPMVANLQGMMGQMGSQEGLGGIMDLAKKIIPQQK